MNRDHWILLGAWGLFGLIHSTLAGESFKNYCLTAMGSLRKYYRLFYSLMALVSLSIVLSWQFFIKSPVIGYFPLVKLFAGIPVGIAGILLMGACIYKYFYQLSGINVFRGETSGEMLETEGMHRYVRHPLYLGTMLFIWALFLFFPLLGNLLACIMITIYTFIGIRFEERKLLRKFGAKYVRYRRGTPMLLPHIGVRLKDEGQIS